MKRRLPLLLSFAAFALPFASLPAAAAADPAPTDPALRLLNRGGAVPVLAAGPYVERGTLRIQVSTKLGRPDLVLSDGTWLYENRHIDGSGARGTLVLRFAKGRVSELALVTPTVALALRANPRLALEPYLVATK